jgi:hypothetical protein
VGQWLKRSNRAEKLVFLGGAARAGTTVTHALICSAQGVSRFHPEIGFFRGAAMSYFVGGDSWDEQTSAFFADQAAFRRLVRETAEIWLDHVWQSLDQPQILCVKDPLLTPYFPSLRDLLPGARFVVVCRHPFDVIRSRQEVAENRQQPFGLPQAIAVAEQYDMFYRQILGNRFEGRSFVLRYEDLHVDAMRTDLARFLGVPGFDTSAMWNGGKSTAKTLQALASSPWMSSPKSFGPIDLERRLDPIPEDWQAAVRPICAFIMDRMDYS